MSRQSLRSRPGNFSPEYFIGHTNSLAKRIMVPELSPHIHGGSKGLPGPKSIGGGLYHFVKKHKRIMKTGAKIGTVTPVREPEDHETPPA